MGGGNNPRQKMIGIMYLVLIAMLALNIDTAVLEKFVLINQSFEVTNEEKEIDNDRKLEAIRAAVDDSGNRTEDVAVLDQAQQLREEARVLMSYMTLIKDSITNMTGGKDSKGKYIGYKDVDAVSRFMVKLGNGDSLQQKLNDYTELVRQVTEDTSIVDLARNADQIPIFELTASKHLPFKELNFGYNTPMVGGLASLSQLQNDLINLEIKALDKLAASVGAADLKFDVVTLTTLPDQKVVAAGAKYKAQLFLSAGSSAIVPIMTANGDTLEVANGRGTYEFTTRPGNYNRDGLAKKTYIGAISVTLPGGRDTTFTDTVEYFVARPVIQIQSASVQALYFNCGNELQVNVPALGSSYAPSFAMQGGEVIKGSKIGQVTLVPKAKNVELRVSNGGNYIGSQKFGVRQIPAPEIQARIRGKQIDGKRGIPISTQSFNLDAIADASFSQFLPKDSKFRVMEAEITLVRSGRGGASFSVKSPKVPLNRLSGQMRKGDALVIEIKRVARANFQGKTENFRNFSPKYINIPLN